jgi:type-F conjugative transfer system pilin assembly protein TrbC
VEEKKLLHFLTIGILLFFSAGVYALNTIIKQPIALEQRQAETLKWIQSLKNSFLEQTEPYLGMAEEMRKEAHFKVEDFQCGCSGASNYLPDTTEPPTEDVVNALSTASPKSKSRAELYVFVSLSMPKPALIALNKEAAQLGATLVLRGLKEDSYQKTAFYLQEIIAKTGQGFLIHPELFKRYAVHQVPSVVLTTNPLGVDAVFDVVSGHIPIKTALSKMAEKGELKDEAKAWAKRGAYAD